MKVILFSSSGKAAQLEAFLRKLYTSADINIIEHTGGLTAIGKKGLLAYFRRFQSDIFVVGLPDVTTQNLLRIWKLLALFTKSRRRFLLDSNGRTLKISWFRFIFSDIPLIATEIVVGLWGFIFSYMVLGMLSRKSVQRFLSSQYPLSHDNRAKFKLAFLRTIPGTTTVGGSVSHIAGFCKGVTSLGHEMFFISTSDVFGVDEKQTPVSVIKQNNVNLAPKEWNIISYNYKYTWHAKNILAKSKPTFIYQRYSAFNFAGVILSKLLRIPLVLEFNSSEVWKGKHWKEWKYLHLLELFEKVNLLSADLITVVSQPLKEELIEKGIPADKIVVNSNGVDVEKFHPCVDGMNVRARYKLHGKTVIGFTGTFSHWHGIPTLASSLKPIIEGNKNVHFLLIGDGPLRGMLEEKIETEKLGRYVTFTGKILHDDVPKFLAACDVLVSPHNPQADGQEFFGSPTKLFEYMAMGKGIVASNLGQIGEVLEHNYSAYLFEPGNADEFTKGVLALSRNRELRYRLGKAARKEVVEKYTWKRNADTVIKAVKTFLGEVNAKSEWY